MFMDHNHAMDHNHVFVNFESTYMEQNKSVKLGTHYPILSHQISGCVSSNKI